jgi:ABC-2 type transport system permease protein
VLMGVPFDAITVDWPLLVVVMALGLEAIVVIGMILAAICLQTRQDSWSYPEAVAGALFLISGAVFPLSVLPLAVQALGLANPLTWWLEGVRRALFPTGASAIGGTGSLYTDLSGELVPSSTTIVLALLVTGAVATLLTAVAFRWSERRARDRGLIDQTTGS